MNQEKIKELEQKIGRQYSNTTGVVVLKEGHLIYEKYFNGCTKESRVHIYSVTKSIVSALVGIALDKGYIKSTEQRVLDFLPDYKVKRGEKTLQNITIRDMLTMTVPYKYHFFSALYQLF